MSALKPESAPYRVPDARCVGLAVRVATDGRITWDLSYRIRGSGTVRRTSLGRFPQVGLDAARDRANQLTKAARAGSDLLAEEKLAAEEAAKRLTIEALIQLYLDQRAAGLRTLKEIGNRLRRALKPLLGRPAADVWRRDIRPLLDEVNSAGASREAEKRRQTVGAMFRWALSRDHVEHDPTAGIEAFDPGTPGSRVLSREEIQALWNWLPGSTFPRDHADVLRLELALGARCGEIAGMGASEIDEKAWTWRLPPDRSKNRKERITPLGGIAREIIEARLRQISRGPLFVSETGKPLRSSHVGAAIGCRRGKLPIEYFGTHDLRRTTASIMDEMGIPLETIALVIGHEPSNSKTRTLVRHYVKGDFLPRKRAVLEAWDAKLRAIIAGSDTGTNVVALRA
ncbi:MAG: tyrosine-type recombinase/integrase [Methylobacteriaceae bacterium]|nr:tyrosine-type recombinase/integrase [Methylobacteriaceae bacterium]